MIDDFRPSQRPGYDSAKQTSIPPKLDSLDFMSPVTVTPAETTPTLPVVEQPAVDTAKLENMLGAAPDAPRPINQPFRQKMQLALPRPNWWRHLSRKQHILLMTAAFLVLAIGSGSAAYFVFHGRKPKAEAVTIVKKKAIVKPPVITTVASTLSGLQVDPSVNNRPVTAIMVENSTDARPQSGIDQAGVVFEAIAEGGITRFMALFQDTQPDYIGPVRSVRPYYEQWALGFDAPMAHVGGSPEALANIKAWGIKDLDQFYNSGAYRRVSNRYAPHNVYTSIANLNAVENSKGYTKSNFTGFARKAEQPYKAPAPTTTTTKKTVTPAVDSRTPATSINLAISSTLFNVNYNYDAATNSYKRILGGQPHMVVDASGAQHQITPKVVIALVTSYGLESDNKHSVYGVIGSGQLYVFQDGTVTQGTWTKPDNASQLQFVDSQGHKLNLNPGQTWITAMGAATDVTYK